MLTGEQPHEIEDKNSFDKSDLEYYTVPRGMMYSVILNLKG
jgi:hypothetical protein